MPVQQLGHSGLLSLEVSVCGGVGVKSMQARLGNKWVGSLNPDKEQSPLGGKMFLFFETPFNFLPLLETWKH